MTTRCKPLELTGPLREPTSWLTWLADVFATTPHRFRHLHAVWGRAVELREMGLPWLEPVMSDRLELAALLHDVGRALDPDDDEPHGFVGARFLDAHGLDDIAPLVAHHSGARLEAAARGMADRDRWTDDDPALLALLTYLDRTTSATGESVSLAQRRRDLAARRGEGSLQLRIFDATMPDVRRAELLGVHAGRRPVGKVDAELSVHGCRAGADPGHVGRRSPVPSMRTPTSRWGVP